MCNKAVGINGVDTAVFVRCCLDLAEKMGCDLVEVTAHMGARPSHAEWQEKVYSISGDSKKYPKLSTATGYGTGAGLKGWNCRHDFYPFFEGISKRANLPVDKKENAKEYELSQKQRAMERSIRKSKRGLSALNESINSTDDDILKEKLQNKFDRQSATLKKQEKRMTQFCKDNDLLVKNDRVRVVGFGKSISQKAVNGNNRYFVKKMKSYGIENPPKTLDIFNQMEYNNPPEYKLMNTYINSVKTGYMSPLVGYDLYKRTYNKVQNEIVGNVTSNGIVIKGQSNHFLERYFGTISNPSDQKGKPRSGVSFDDIKEALFHGKALKPKVSCDKNGNILYDENGNPKISQKFVTEKCEVSINPDTYILIQCNPK
jgi:hypothetical protein